MFSEFNRRFTKVSEIFSEELKKNLETFCGDLFVFLKTVVTQQLSANSEEAKIIESVMSVSFIYLNIFLCIWLQQQRTIIMNRLEKRTLSAVKALKPMKKLEALGVEIFKDALSACHASEYVT